MKEHKNFPTMIYNFLKTIPFIFHPFQQLNYSLGARREEEKMYQARNEK